jgi:hypothetical protein
MKEICRGLQFPEGGMSKFSAQGLRGYVKADGTEFMCEVYCDLRPNSWTLRARGARDNDG